MQLVCQLPGTIADPFQVAADAGMLRRPVFFRPVLYAFNNIGILKILQGNA